MKQDSEIGSADVISLSAIVLVVVLLFLFGWPNYTVWTKTLNGKATLQEAEYSRRVRIEEAKAKEESAALEAKAEVTRAEGTAKANEILGKTLSPQMLQYQYIRMLEEQSNSSGERTVIYIPTQNGIPVLPQPEAGRLLLEKK